MTRIAPTAYAVAVTFGLSGSVAAQTETMKPAIWIDPDGCEHWVMDDGIEGYMSPHLRRDGTPVCHRKNLCGTLSTDLLFSFDSARVSENGRDQLARVVAGSPARAYIVAGHTDDQGADAYNLNLSQQRARAVADLLKSMNAPVSEVQAYGERRPKASNDTDAGRRANRRVEIICLK